MANQFLALSMFVMLLSFFIILNAMSNFEEIKARDVLTSITVAFSKEQLPDDLNANIVEAPEKSYHEGNTLDKLRELFEAQIAGVKTKTNRLGTIMHLRMQLDDFEKQLAAPGTAFGGTLAPTLVSLLSAEDDVPYSMEMLINLDKNPATLQNETPQNVVQNVTRVAGYARLMEDAGLPKKYLSAGLSEGEPGTIDLYFKRYEPFNPVGHGGEE
ncbi:MAG: hypothetical protein KDJ35_02020 [Alphaproteobacteria bacterium]|nr:hypothetical protein [Alphaproteobacteria bacterium]